MGTRIYIRLLGPFTVALDPDFSSVIPLSMKKEAALFSVLALSPGMRCSRETLAGMLWGGSQRAQARQSLRQALTSLRNDFGNAPVFHTDADSIALNRDIVSVDTHTLEILTNSSSFSDLERAFDLTKEDFLSGFRIEEESFGEWQDEKREYFALLAARVAEAYTAQADKLERAEQALAGADRLLKLDPLREDWHRIALRIRAKYVNNSDALSLAVRLRNILKTELNVTPEAATEKLVAQIKLNAKKQEEDAPIALSANGVSPARSAQPGETAATKIAPGRTTGSIAAIAVGVIIVAGLAFVLPAALQNYRIGKTAQHSSHSQRPRLAGVEKGIVTIVVLPLRTTNGNGDATAAFSSFVTDELISTLSTSSHIRVISRETSLQFGTGYVDARALGAELGVHYALEGSISSEADRFRIDIALVDAQNGLRVWSRRLELTEKEWSVAWHDLLKGISRQLQVELPSIESSYRTDSADVHLLISSGWALYYKSGTQGKRALLEAEQHFNRALKLEPDNVHAKLGLAAFHINLAAQLLTPEPKRHLQLGNAIVDEIIEHRPHTPAAHFFKGLAYVADNKMQEAAAAFRRVVEINPSHAGAYAQLGRALARLGNLKDGLANIQYAMRLSPRDPGIAYWHGFAGWTLLEMDQLPQALAQFKMATALQPIQARTALSMVAATALSGDLGEAKRLLRELQKHHPHLTYEALVKHINNLDGSNLQKGLRLALSQNSANSEPIK